MLHGSGNLSSMTTTDCLRHSSGKPMTFFSLEAGRHTQLIRLITCQSRIYFSLPASGHPFSSFFAKLFHFWSLINHFFGNDPCLLVLLYGHMTSHVTMTN